MGIFILTWHPVGTPWDGSDYAKVVAATTAGRRTPWTWSTGVRQGGIGKDDHAYLFRQFEDRGIVGRATVTSGVYRGPHWQDGRRQANYVRLRWDRLVEVPDRLTIEKLESEIPEFSWIHLQGSGVRLADDIGDRLGDLWAAHLGSVPFHSADEVLSEAYPEGAVQRVEVNRYERNAAARTACIDHWGTTCAVCGFDFGAAYGRIGDGYIHVHHLLDLAQVGPGYEVDPVKDLRPVCPNCHAMLHTTRPAMSISSLKRRLGAGAGACG